MAESTFAELGRIEAIRTLFEGTGYKAFENLSFQAQNGSRITGNSKVFLEGIDFDLTYFPLKHLGYKSVVSASGELLAEMAAPESLGIVLGVSAKLDFAQIKEIWEGMVAAAGEFHFKRLSLDLVPSRNGLCISLSATGEVSAEVLAKRPQTRSKDLLCVSGRLGAAFIGQQILEQEKSRFEAGAAADNEKLEKNRMLVAAYLKPELNGEIVRSLTESGIVPSSGIFITRGLADAVLTLQRQSGLGVKVYADKIPFEGNSFSMGKELDIDPVSAAMNGGDDCQLLFTIPIMQAEKFRRDFQTFNIIGHLALPEAGSVLVLPTGVEMPVTAQGWNR